MMARTLMDRVLPAAGETDTVDWDEVYRRELPRIFNFFRYRVPDRATAEDLTSTTFEKAWTARHRYRRDQAAFSTWLFTIARNVAIDFYRRRRPEVPLGDEIDPPSGITPEEEALRRSRADRLWSMLQELPERERELVALKFGADVTNRAIAKVMGLSESNVGTILHRTVAALRARWIQVETERGSPLTRSRDSLPATRVGDADRARDRKEEDKQ
jgi:RNA polymerase sigma-70 factor, ECF subfamily